MLTYPQKQTGTADRLAPKEPDMADQVHQEHCLCKGKPPQASVQHGAASQGTP